MACKQVWHDGDCRVVNEDVLKAEQVSEGGRERYCRFPFASNRPVPDSGSVQGEIGGGRERKEGRERVLCSL